MTGQKAELKNFISQRPSHNLRPFSVKNRLFFCNKNFFSADFCNPFAFAKLGFVSSRYSHSQVVTDEAQLFRKQLVNMGFKDAFVASYQDGKRVKIEDPY